MPEQINTTSAAIEPVDPQAVQFFDQIFGTARASAVYSEPVTSGAYTIITASEVGGAGGFGSGRGFGPAPARTSAAADPTLSAPGGGGSGGGAGAIARPVAVIVVGPDGVQVKPIFDVTKFGLAVLTTWAAILMTVVQLRRQKKSR